ncbi:MAG TPA: thioesterase family protein [Polyangiales bacterium]|nr:thioesterase family protein [Polyangiales bacterium]
MVMMEVLRSSVNEWECDQMGHLNVRHYFGRANEGLALLLAELGLGPSRLRQEGLAVRALDQHVRFQREMRPGTAYCVRAGVVSATSDVLHTYQEIDVRPQAELSATFLSDLGLYQASTGIRRPFPAQLAALSDSIQAEVPPHGAARGITRDQPRAPMTRTEAIERGLVGAFLGPVRAEECDPNGLMRESGMMAKVADGMSHFFLALRERPRADGVGGAALEYRFVFRKWPRLGDFVEVRSGLKGLGAKTYQICHFIFDVESGECLASSEAVTVSFDLTTRKAMEIPPDFRASLEQQVIPGLAV